MNTASAALEYMMIPQIWHVYKLSYIFWNVKRG